MNDMGAAKEIFNPIWWAARLALAKEKQQIHQTVFKVTEDAWMAICARTRGVLAAHLGKCDDLVDVGCGYGSLVDLLPKHWNGSYCGLDVAPALIEEAKLRHPSKLFMVHDMRTPFNVHPAPWDLAVLVGMREMIKGREGSAAWDLILANVRSAARRVLIIPYDLFMEPELIPGDHPRRQQR